MRRYQQLLTLVYLARLALPAYLAYQLHDQGIIVHCEHEPLLRLYLGLSALSFVTVCSAPAVLAYQFQLLVVAIYSYSVAECNNSEAWKYLKGDFLLGSVIWLITGIKLACHRWKKTPPEEPPYGITPQAGGIYLVGGSDDV